MRKLSTLLGNTPDNQLRRLTQQTNAYRRLSALWNNAAPKMLAQFSSVGELQQGQLTIYAHNAAVATKIRLTSASLLTRLQQLQATEPFDRDCKVTAISVKVQVKYPTPPRIKPPRQISTQAARALSALAEQLDDSTLAQKLRQLAEKSKL